MLYIFLGPDDYSKKSFISALVKDKGADLVVYHQDDELPGASRLTETDLFSKPKVFVLPDLPPPQPSPQGGGNNLMIVRLISSANYIIISIDKIDKRKKENKDLLSLKDITVKEFNLPHGLELNKWIEQRVKKQSGKISKPAIEELAIRLGRDNTKEIKAAGKIISTEEVYSLWQADSEIKKLMAYASGRQIELEDVQAIVSENLEVDAFEIINAIGEGKKQLVMDLMQEFLRADSAGDEKAGILQLNALLSDQMRSLAITQDFIKSKVSDTEIIKRTAWKSGRLYVMKKISAHLSSSKVLETMKKLEALDEELKTSQTPPRVLLDMILAQVF